MTTSKDEHSVRSKEPARKLIAEQTKAFEAKGGKIEFVEIIIRG